VRVRVVEVSGEGQCPGAAPPKAILIALAGRTLASGHLMPHLGQDRRIEPYILQLISHDIPYHDRDKPAGSNVPVGFYIERQLAADAPLNERLGLCLHAERGDDRVIEEISISLTCCFAFMATR